MNFWTRCASRTALAATALAACLLVTPFTARAAAALTAEQKAAVDQLIHDYLLQHPEVLTQAIQQVADEADAAQRAAGQSALGQHTKELFDDPAAPILGNPSGDVTLVEFFDYQCPYCKETAAIVDGLIAGDPGVRIVMKEYPVLPAPSDFAARIALVAARHGRFAAFHDAIYKLDGRLTEERILGVAAQIGLDPKAARREARDPEIDAAINANLDLGKNLAIDGTPSFIVAGTIIPGEVTLADLRQAVAVARKKG
jgi:protein-disulfide isomerase